MLNRSELWSFITTSDKNMIQEEDSMQKWDLWGWHKIGLLNRCRKSTTSRAIQCLYPLKWLRYEGYTWLKQISEGKKKKKKNTERNCSLWDDDGEQLRILVTKSRLSEGLKDLILDKESRRFTRRLRKNCEHYCRRSFRAKWSTCFDYSSEK